LRTEKLGADGCQDRVHPGGDIGRVHVHVRRSAPLVPAAGRRDQDGPAAGGGSRRDVAVRISNHPRRAEVHVELRRRIEEHARGGLPAPARLPQFRHRRLGMVETAPDRVRYDPLAPQQVEHALLDCAEPLEGGDALRGRRLVRDRYQQVTRVPKAAEGGSRVWN
jgi:hypothetical protein